MDERLLINTRREELDAMLLHLDDTLLDSALAYIGGDPDAWIRFTNAYDSLQAIHREFDLLDYAERKLGTEDS